MPIGLSEVTGEPDRIVLCEICAYWPFASVSWKSVLAAPAGIPPPPAIDDFGRIVMCVSSSIATRLSDGPCGTEIGACEVASYAVTAT